MADARLRNARRAAFARLLPDVIRATRTLSQRSAAVADPNYTPSEIHTIAEAIA
jgi:hypothetical protein